TAGLPYGVVVGNLAGALATHGAVLEAHLARHAGFDRDVFAAVNTSHLRDGAFVWIARQQKCPTPVELLFVSTQEAVTYPRCLVVVEGGAECNIVEHHASLTDGAYFTNAVTEIVLGQEARLQHVKLQQEGPGAFHIASCAVA